MSGETNLNQLIKNMEPKLNDGEYVFASVRMPDHTIPPEKIIGSFQEAGGVTLILPKAAADAYGLNYDYIAAWITLTVHSSLSAVGLTAAVAKALSDAKISCNVVAAYYHDHIFVDSEKAQLAVTVLRDLSHTADTGI